MKTTHLLLSLFAAAALLGCSTTAPHQDFTGMPSTDITVTVKCSDPAMQFTGSIVTDGHVEQLSGAGSATYHATGHQFVCKFKKVQPDGRISIEVSEAGNGSGSSTTDKKFGGVYAEILHTPSNQHCTFTTL